MSLKVEQVNSDIVEIWEDHSHFLTDRRPSDESPWPRWPALYDELVDNPDVLYVGLNPSFHDRQMKRRLEEFSQPLALEDLRWTGYEQEIADFLQWERGYAKENYSYFKPMREFASEHGLTWDHIDVFILRLTSQNKLEEALDIGAYAEGEHQHPFLRRQVDLFFDLLGELSPGVIVVENAFARDFLKETRLTNDRYNLTPENGVDPETGYQTTNLDGVTPIFFSGMLSGQRALDIGSRQRLHWHVLQALNEAK